MRIHNCDICVNFSSRSKRRLTINYENCENFEGFNASDYSLLCKNFYCSLKCYKCKNQKQIDFVMDVSFINCVNFEKAEKNGIPYCKNYKFNQNYAFKYL
jgi:hypothetical protein